MMNATLIMLSVFSVVLIIVLVFVFVFNLKSVDNIRVWWRMASLNLGAAGTAIVSVLVLVPDWAYQVWAILPDEMKAAIPPAYMPMIGVIFYLLGMAARLIKQRNLPKDTRDGTD